eukprot:Amastigsp_a2668_6.p5 type:complete len:110 gc:universal Amastigsp_a2668_6:468-139(-)
MPPLAWLCRWTCSVGSAHARKVVPRWSIRSSLHRESSRRQTRSAVEQNDDRGDVVRRAVPQRQIHQRRGDSLRVCALLRHGGHQQRDRVLASSVPKSIGTENQSRVEGL